MPGDARLFFVVDITNLCRWGLPGKTSMLGRFDLIKQQIDAQWPEAIVHWVADLSWRHDFALGSPDRVRVERYLEQRLIEQAPVADKLLLDYAQVYGGYIITNDRYRDHADQYPEVVPGRLIQCDFVGTAKASLRFSQPPVPIVGQADPIDLRPPARSTAPPRPTVPSYVPPAAYSPPTYVSPQSAPAPGFAYPRAARRRSPLPRLGVVGWALAAALCLLLLAVFGSSASWALGLVATVLAIAGVIWFIREFGAHIIAAIAYAVTAGLMGLCLYTAWAARGPLGGVLLLIGVAIAWALYATARGVATRGRAGSALDTFTIAGIALLIILGAGLGVNIGASLRPRYADAIVDSPSAPVVIQLPPSSGDASEADSSGDSAPSRMVVPASSELAVPLGTTDSEGRYVFTVTGTIVAVSRSGNGPEGDRSHRTSDLLVPGEPGGGLLIKVGPNGTWHPLASLDRSGDAYEIRGMSGARVYAVVNDAPGTYGDNSGSFEIHERPGAKPKVQTNKPKKTRKTVTRTLRPPDNIERVSAPLSGDAGTFRPVHTYDLGAIRKVTRIEITWTAGNPGEQGGTGPTEFHRSTDNADWLRFGTATGIPHQAKTVTFSDIGEARYIRISCPTKYVDDSSIKVTYRK